MKKNQEIHNVCLIMSRPITPHPTPFNFFEDFDRLFFLLRTTLKCTYVKQPKTCTPNPATFSEDTN